MPYSHSQGSSCCCVFCLYPVLLHTASLPTSKHLFPTQVAWGHIMCSTLFSPIWMHLLRSCGLGEEGPKLPSLTSLSSSPLADHFVYASYAALNRSTERTWRCKRLFLVLKFGTAAQPCYYWDQKHSSILRSWLDAVTKSDQKLILEVYCRNTINCRVPVLLTYKMQVHWSDW